MIRSLSIPMVAMALVSCSASTPVLDTGVPDGTQVDEITDAQARQICESAEALANDVLGVEEQHRVFCVATGIGYDVADLGMCKDSFDDCIAEPYEGEDFDFDCEAVTAPTLSGCDATIGELERCANAQLALYDDILSELDCGLADDPERLDELLDELEADANPEACASLPESCPIFFGGIGEEMME